MLIVRRRFDQRAWAGSSLGLTAAMVVGCSFDLGSPRNGWTTFRKLEAANPAGLGSAILVTGNSSFAGSDAWVFIRDGRRSERPMRLGGSYASDSFLKMKHGVWSRDGSLFAVQVRIGETAGKRFRKYYGAYFVAGYDFRTQQLVTPGPSAAATSKRLEELSKQRGGKGPVVFTQPYMAEGSEMTEVEAKEYGKLR